MLHEASGVVWCEGYVAGYAGQPLTTNPYGDEPKLAAVWVKAWLDGQVDELHERRCAHHRAGEGADKLRPG
jgi:ribosome modulation factor